MGRTGREQRCDLLTATKSEFPRAGAGRLVPRRLLSFGGQFRRSAFAQLTLRENLHDIQACLRQAQPKLYHICFWSAVARNTLAHANEVRDWRIYADFAQGLIATARNLYATKPCGVEFGQTVYALESLTINLRLTLFAWAALRKRRGAVELLAALDFRGVFSHAGERARREPPRPTRDRGRYLLYLRPGLPRFWPALPPLPGPGGSASPGPCGNSASAIWTRARSTAPQGSTPIRSSDSPASTASSATRNASVGSATSMRRTAGVRRSRAHP